MEGPPGSEHVTVVKVETRTAADLAAASTVVQEQVMETLRLHGPIEGEDLSSFVEALSAGFGAPAKAIELERCEIRVDGAHLLDLWMYLGEHGVVFEKGDSVPTAVRCVQASFWSVDDDDTGAVAWANVLNRVANL